MDTHKNARLTPKGREQMVHCVVDGGPTCAATARKSSRPLSSDSQTPQATCDAVEVLRRQRYTGKQIARELGISPATVSRILRRRGLNKLSALEPAEPVRRYEREKAGELIHLDIKKLGRIGSVRAPHQCINGRYRAISRAGLSEDNLLRPTAGFRMINSDAR